MGAGRWGGEANMGRFRRILLNCVCVEKSARIRKGTEYGERNASAYFKKTHYSLLTMWG